MWCFLLSLLFLRIPKNVSSEIVEQEQPVSISCPDNPESPATHVPNGVTIQIEKSPEFAVGRLGHLCLLARISIDDEGDSHFAPVARSYDGYDWENVAGPYDTFTSILEMDINCPDRENVCTLQVPNATTPNQSFRLIKYEHSLSTRDEAARFVEQSTFGTTSQDLRNVPINTSNSDGMLQYFINQLHYQIYEISPTLHRTVWRERATSKINSAIREGITNHPCEVGAIWTSMAFDHRRDDGKFLTISNLQGKYALSIDGYIRTVVKNINLNGATFDYSKLPITLKICSAFRESFQIRINGVCKTVTGGNPSINLDGVMVAQAPLVLDLDERLPNFVKHLDPNDEGLVNELMMVKKATTLIGSICQSMPDDGVPIFARLVNGQIMMFDSRLKLQSNTLSEPLEDGGGDIVKSSNSNVRCSNAPRTFLNEDTCYLSTSQNACSNIRYAGTTKIQLDKSTLADIFRLTGRYIYVARGLRQWSPYIDYSCKQWARSRWVPLPSGEECYDYDLNESTAAIFRHLLHTSKDDNPYMKDVFFSGGVCHPNDEKRRKFYVLVDGVCWTNVHPDEFNVYDFSDWVSRHPGGAYHIKKFADNGSVELIYPGQWHEMYRWHLNIEKLEFFGRFGDAVSIDNLPVYFRDNYLDEAFAILNPIGASGVGTLVCGSPGESANHESYLPSYRLMTTSDSERSRSKRRADFRQQRKNVWTQVVLVSKDQIRQKVAWFLSEIFAVSPEPFDLTMSTEMFTAFYDIFVRNAFKNYRDILKEVSYSPLMAEMLSYHGSKSKEYIWKTAREIKFSDENYAREVMQLFSIGLHKLNMDGTHKLDNFGDRILTYTNNEIEEYARVWTGFTRQSMRGNIEQQESGMNSIDPMTLSEDWRDAFPKRGLDGKYIGDEYMLCSDLPAKLYLRKGAKYRLLGNSKIALGRAIRNASSNIHVIELSEQSTLRGIFCMPNDGQCRYPSSVTLSESLSCVGVECDLDQVQVIKVAENMYYEYVRPPCVQLAFFSPGNLASFAFNPEATAICVDKTSAVASVACCSPGSKIGIHDTCNYTGERIALADAESRCALRGRTLCAFESLDSESCGKCCNYKGRFWYKRSLDGIGHCNIIIVVDADGKVALERSNAERADYHSLTFFRVNWDDKYPNTLAACGNATCEIVNGYCRCKVKTSSIVKFSSAPQSQDILRYLRVGGVPPSLKDYAGSENHNGLVTHFAELGVYDENVVFEVTDHFGRTLYLKNSVEVVNLLDNNGEENESYSFRNPPIFLKAAPDERDASYETDAALDHYFYHDNTAPFLAQRFIQRFGQQSNPSPRFIQSVAEAFKSGTYVIADTTFGTSKYGDLSATVAAVLLDREARHFVLDQDPSHGSIREPLLKFIALMKSMKYQTSSDTVGLYNANSVLGQNVWELPSVFGFFDRDFAPQGSVSRSSLVAPEAALLNKSLNLVNAMLSLIRFGLTSCHFGLGNAPCSKSPTGYLSYAPPNEINSPQILVDELATLLTSGRLSASNRLLVSDAISDAYFDTNPEKDALSLAQQLIISSAEFHTTALSNNSFIKRAPENSDNVTRSCNGYKAVIHLLLQGGMDSYNLLVPNSGCSGKVSYDQYKEVRGSVALPQSSLVPINANNSDQTCKMFGLHPNMPILKELYENNDASFIAGIGVMTRHVNKTNYLENTSTTLFTHKEMRHEIGRLDPFSIKEDTGFLGRLADRLTTKGHKTNSFSVDNDLSAVQGRSTLPSKISLDSMNGFIQFDPSADDDFIKEHTQMLNGKSKKDYKIFSETWSSALNKARSESQSYYSAQNFAEMDDAFTDESFGRELKSVAQMIASSECRGSDRDIFSLSIKQFDHHINLLPNMEKVFTRLNDGLQSFVNEMKDNGMWDKVTIVISSDFGRSLTSNSQAGTDHGWSGHSFILGGALDGGQIHGKYPDDLSDASDLSLGRGRLIPELPWEAQWNAVTQWMGVDDEEGLNYVLPNRPTFMSELLHRGDLFKPSVEQTTVDCIGEGDPISCSTLNSPPHLSNHSLTHPLSSQETNLGDNSDFTAPQSFDLAARSEKYLSTVNTLASTSPSSSKCAHTTGIAMVVSTIFYLFA